MQYCGLPCFRVVTSPGLYSLQFLKWQLIGRRKLLVGPITFLCRTVGLYMSSVVCSFLKRFVYFFECMLHYKVTLRKLLYLTYVYV